MTHSFRSKKLEETDISVRFEFVSESGISNFDLQKTVFGEYIEEPILMRSHAGLSFVLSGQCPLLDNMMHYTVTEDAANNKIIFTISSQLLKNKIVDTVVEEAGIVYMKLPEGTIIKLANVTDRTISQILYLFVLLDMLDGMVINVDIEDYYPSCKNCAVNKTNLLNYIKLAEENIQQSVEASSGCILNFSCFDIEKKIVECGNFIRSKNPDIQGLFETISIIPEIKNL